MYGDMGNTWRMPWSTQTTMSQRLEFVQLASKPGANIRQLCRRYNISPKTGYKWLRRYKCEGTAGLAEQSRRPKNSPRRCAQAVAAEVIAVRREHPTWGARKLRRRLQDLQKAVPSTSTCTAILRRAELLPAGPAASQGPFQRFERSQPNDLWQLDFKGHFPTQAGPRCHPLTMLDDYSRFNLLLLPLAEQTGEVVLAALLAVFAQYGLPNQLLCDNGPPWGASDPVCPHTTLSVALLRRGVQVIHGRPYHPQTQGKEERFHRTLHADLIARHTWRDLAHCAAEFPRFRQIYNSERPHDALQGATPLSRYQVSSRSLPAVLPAIEYPAGTTVCLAPRNGWIGFGGQRWYVGRAFGGLPIGLRPSAQADGQWEVFFDLHRLGSLDLRLPPGLHSIYSFVSSTSTPPASS